MATLGNFVSGQVLTAAELNDIGTWTTFTPVFTNFTLGNGSVDARYCQINDVVLVSGRITLGSTSSVSGRIDINYPVGFQVSSQGFNGTVRYTDTGTASSAGWLVLYTTTFGFQVLNAAGTYVSPASTSATVPHTWAATDFIDFTMWYQKA